MSKDWTCLDTVEKKSDFKFSMVEYAGSKSPAMRRAVLYVEKKVAEIAGNGKITLTTINTALLEYETRKAPDIKMEVLRQLDKILALTGKNMGEIENIALDVLQNSDEVTQEATLTAIRRTADVRENLGSTNIEVFEKYLDGVTGKFQEKLKSRTYEQYHKAARPSTDMGVNMDVTYKPESDYMFRQ